MNILMAVASKHGSTYEIAEAIAEELRMDGYAVDVRHAEQAVSVDAYDAAVIGSAVYAGSWLPQAQQFVERHREQLLKIPVWLFSSGPLGDEPPESMGSPANLDELLATTDAHGHQVFAGKLDGRQLNLGERLIVRVVKAPFGDFRDWEAIRSWAHDVAAALAAVPAG